MAGPPEIANRRNNDYLGSEPRKSSGCEGQGYRGPKPFEAEARKSLRRAAVRCASKASWIPSAAAVRAGDDFKKVTIRILEVDTASAVVVIDLTSLAPAGIGPVGKFSIPDPT